MENFPFFCFEMDNVDLLSLILQNKYLIKRTILLNCLQIETSLYGARSRAVTDAHRIIQKLIKMNKERRIGSIFFLSVTSGTFVSIEKVKNKKRDSNENWHFSHLIDTSQVALLTLWEIYIYSLILGFCL